MEVHSAISATKMHVTHRHTQRENITVGAKTTLATPCLIEPNACHLEWADLCDFHRFSVSRAGRPHSLRPISLVGFCAASARGALDHDDWQASPLHVTGSLDNLPPIMVVYGEDGRCRLQSTTFSTLACGYACCA